jgi:drug/metabolite transporter (DMT)-like permease
MPIAECYYVSSMHGRNPTISPLGRVHWLGYLSLCLIWGSTWLAIRVVVRGVPPFRAAAIRFFAAAALLLVTVLFRKNKWPHGDRQWNAILVLGFTMFAIPYALVFWAEQYVTSSMTAVLFSANPLAVALLTPFMMQRKVPRQAVFAMLMAFGGLLYLCYSGLRTDGRAVLAGLAILLSMSMSAWSAVFAKKRLHDVDTVAATGLQMLIGAFGLLWATWALEAHQPAIWSRQIIGALIFLVLFGSAAAFAVYYWLLKSMQPYQLSTINLVVPIIAVLVGALVGHELVPVKMIAAMVVVLASVGVVLWAESEGPYEGEEFLSIRGSQ